MRERRIETLVRRGVAVCLLASGIAAVAIGCDGDDKTSSRPGGSAQAAATGSKPPIPDMVPIDESEEADADYGKDLFLFGCATCHGTNGQGLPHQGADLRISAFMREKTDKELLEYIRVGRTADAPDNVMKVAMPPRGNPQVDDGQLSHVVAYLRQMQAEADAAGISGQASKPQGAVVPPLPERSASSSD